MIKFSKVVLPAVLAIAMLAPVSAYAHGGKGGHRGGPPPKDKPAVTQQTAKPAMKGHHSHAQRPAIKPPMKPTGKPGHAKGQMSVMKQTFFTLLVEKYSADTLPAWEAAIADSNKLHADIKAIITANPELKKTLKAQHTVDLKAKMEANKATKAEFQAAVVAKDAEKIKASLATILTKITDRNKVLASKLAALQKAVADKEAANTPTDPGTTDPGTTDPTTAG